LEVFFVVAFGVIMAASAYLLLSRNVLRMVLGLLVLSNGVNLAIFTAGRLGSMVPPITLDVADAATAMANPLPQALILTAIVISFALTAFAVVLFERAHRTLGTLDTEEMRTAEPPRGAVEKSATL
jgi:multicomponent Na+:H+ antiporter subunit C